MSLNSRVRRRRDRRGTRLGSVAGRCGTDRGAGRPGNGLVIRAEGQLGARRPAIFHMRMRKPAVLACIAALLYCAWAAMPASAHALLLRSNPPSNAALAQAPAQVELFFSEAVQVGLSTRFGAGFRRQDRGPGRRACGREQSHAYDRVGRLPWLTASIPSPGRQSRRPTDISRAARFRLPWAAARRRLSPARPKRPVPNFRPAP